jgi:hypothetical protein
MKTPCHINNSVDLVLGGAPHHGPCPPVIIGSVEGATQCWPPGYACNQNKLTQSVKHHQFGVVLEGHDMGTMIPHLTLPLASNPWLAYIMPMSSCKIQFSASTVKMENTAVGCASVLVIAPMMTCGEPTGSPLSIPVSNCFVDTVKVGMTPGDLWMGWEQILMTVLMNLMVHYAFGSAPSTVMNKYLEQFALSNKELCKRALAFVTGYLITGTGKFNIGIPLLKIELELKRDQNQGDIIDGEAESPEKLLPSESKLSFKMWDLQWELSSKDGGSQQIDGQKPEKLF